ncbi:hypothetical protein [Nitrospina gracilis]|uniref:hypothetical protein n=1 Tax=Nitrospina gracilis TaxID=35801 RepID=UPI001F2D52D2|nr:hypothetical protein [Nitrospina gracilis]MCF8720068.1 DNA-binding NtrC family response regulator [Nitrospina gracilis Nb-211]
MDYKTIFIVDPVKYERIQLAKFLKQESFTVMSFVSLANAFGKRTPIQCDLLIYVLRKGQTDLKALERVKKKDRSLHFILMVQHTDEKVELEPYREMGFENIFIAANNEKVREIAYGYLAPDGLQSRPETPHPLPLP